MEQGERMDSDKNFSNEDDIHREAALKDCAKERDLCLYEVRKFIHFPNINTYLVERIKCFEAEKNCVVGKNIAPSKLHKLASKMFPEKPINKD